MKDITKTTLEYYNTNAASFVESTAFVEFNDTQTRFANKLDAGARILDFGCGSGRDTKYFYEHGYNVDAIDGSIELCKIATAHSGVEVKHMYFQDLDEDSVYDGIWACSSILHLPVDELEVVLKKMVRATKSGGILYTSFKYGTFCGERNGRYFTDMTEETFGVLLERMPDLTIEDLWITTDVRPGRGEERWLNMILRKTI